MGTPGKLVLGLKVGDLRDGRLSLGRAVLRAIAKILSWIPIGLGFVLIGIVPEKRGLHDLVAGTRVYKGPDCAWSRIILGIALAVVLAIVNGFVSPAREAKSTSPHGRGSMQQQTLSPAEEALKRQFESEMNKAFKDAMDKQRVN